MANRINILDDEVLKRNRSMLESGKDSAEINSENTQNLNEKQEEEINFERAESTGKDREQAVEINTTSSEEKKDVTEVSTEDEGLEYKRQYREDGIFSKAVSATESTEVESVDDIQSLENRESRRTDELGIFLYNLLPYIGTNTYQGVVSAITDPDIFGLAVSASTATLDRLFKMKYFTPEELVQYYAANFYTMWFYRGITIKSGMAGTVNSPSGVKQWDGRTDIFYGTNQQSILRDVFEGVLDTFGIGGGANEEEDDGSANLTKYKEGPGGFSPELNINMNLVQSSRRTNPKNLLNTLVVDEVQSQFFNTSLTENQFINGRWRVNTRARQNFNRIDLARSRENHKISFTRKSRDYEFIEIDGNPSFLSDREESNLNDSINAKQEKELTWDSSDGVLRVNFTRMGGNPNSDADRETEDSIKDAIRTKGNTDKDELGYVYVIPVAEDDELPRFKIPFEFNPDINEGGIEARYESQNILSRVGDLYSYANTSNLTVTIDAKYFALAGEEGEVDADGASWMNDFTLKKIQGIEMAYRSLVMPYFPASTEESQGFTYLKPPLIKVRLGDVEDQTAPYANLLTYATNEMVDGRLQSASRYGGKKHRTFIATGVEIKKDLNESPIYLNESGKIRDTFGFEVSLSLTEVTPSYMDTYPDYKKYFNRFKNAGWSSHIDQ